MYYNIYSEKCQPSRAKTDFNRVGNNFHFLLFSSLPKYYFLVLTQNFTLQSHFLTKKQTQGRVFFCFLKNKAGIMLPAFLIFYSNYSISTLSSVPFVSWLSLFSVLPSAGSSSVSPSVGSSVSVFTRLYSIRIWYPSKKSHIKETLSS